MTKENNEERQKEALIMSLGVFELRGLARELGVPSPTTKKREELIALIFEKLKEGSVSEISLQKRGRPYKKLTSLNDIFLGGDNKKKEVKNFESAFTFMQTSKPIIFDISEEIRVFEGFIRRQEECFYLIDVETQEKIYIEKKIQGTDLLELGAFVKVEAKRLKGSEEYWASKILEINNEQLFEYIPLNFQNGEEVISNKSIPYACSEAKEGRRNIFCYNEDLYENDNFKNLMDFCKKNEYQLILLSLSTSYENQIMFRKIGVDNRFITEYGVDLTISLNKIYDLCNYVNFLIKRGEKFVVFIPDILDVARIIEEVHIDSQPKTMGYSQETILVLRKLLAMGRAYKNGCSATVIMGYNENNKDDKFLNSDILRISKKIN